MAAENAGSLKKSSREDLLLMIRELVEDNEKLRRQLSQVQSGNGVAGDTAPAIGDGPAADAAPKREDRPETGAQALTDGDKSQIIISLDALRASVDACTDAILAFNKNRAENR